MEVQNKIFLQAFRAYLRKEKVNWDKKMPKEVWAQLFKQADQHHVLPMIYEAVYDCPAAKKTNEAFFVPYKRSVVQQVMLQAMRTEEFLDLYRFLQDRGIEPLVVKGIICREFYPNLDYRVSGDEDLLIAPEQFEKCHEAMQEYGMRPAGASEDDEEDIVGSYEVPYVKDGSPLYIELHKSLFPPESGAYGEMNQYFENVHERAIKVNIKGVEIATMEYTDHLYYLICHALKHFLHSGFGIRQVCDIALFANEYGSQIDWNVLRKQCKMIHTEQFASALFKIGYKYMTFSPEKACYPEKWRKILVDETAMIEDLLAGGIYGNADMSRVHSSTITLKAVEAQKKGLKGKGTFVELAFPPAKALEKRYTYLKKYPVLLPVAWVSRLVKYQKEVASDANNSAVESIRIGNERIELLKKYGIIDG